MTMGSSINVATTRWSWALGGAVPAPLIGPVASVISGGARLTLIFNGPGTLLLQPMRGQDTNTPTAQSDLAPVMLKPITPYSFILFPTEWSTPTNPQTLPAAPSAIPCGPGGVPLQPCTVASVFGVSVALPIVLGLGCAQGNFPQQQMLPATWTVAVMLRSGIYTPGSYSFELTSPV